MEGYLGEFPVDISMSEYRDWGPTDWALQWIEQYGQTDGDHHKTWVLDQVVRILKGTPVIVTEARWSNGYREQRFALGDPTESYMQWVSYMRGGDEDEANSYEYSIGVAP